MPTGTRAVYFAVNSEAPIELSEHVLLLILSFVRDLFASDGLASYSFSLMRAIGSATRAWRRLAKQALTSDDRAVLVVSGAGGAAECLSAFPHVRSLRIDGNVRAGEVAAVLASRLVERLWLQQVPERRVDLRPLSALVNLRKLCLADFDRLRDVRPLSTLVGLHTLKIRALALRDVRPLSTLVALRTLKLHCCQFLRDVRPLSRLVGLHTLVLRCCQFLRDVRPLSTLVGLHTLDISCSEQLSDVRPLSKLVALRVLRLHYCQLLSNVRALSRLVRLHRLDLGECYELRYLQPISTLVDNMS
jgi:hypothetical protein